MGGARDRSHLDHSSMILLPPTIVGLNDTTLPADSVVSGWDYFEADAATKVTEKS